MSLAEKISSSARPEGRTQQNPVISGRYTVLEQLGAGGMGIVYRARDETTGATVALKQLLSASSGSRKRKVETLFEREYHTLVRLKHPRIIEVYDYGLTADGPYYTMELLEGGDLQQLAPLPWRDVCRHLCDVASSLALLHAHRLVHRDITPRNIRLGTDGRAKLIDFGALSVFGPAQDVVGTPLCMAPEVLQRGALDQRSDLFALGVVGYFALTGSHAFPVRSLEELPQLWKRGAVPPEQLQPELPSALSALIMALISVDPLSRPLHAAQVIDQLCAIAGIEVSDSELAADSYLASGRLVGRKTEQDWVERRIERALRGHGTEALVSGAAGSGKTRLLREIGLDAQLHGMLVVQADAQTTSGYFGLAVALALDLLARGGTSVHSAAEPYAGLVAQLAPALRERFAATVLEPLAPNPAEQRARFQAALHGWFSSVLQTQPVLMAIDNLQSADESSAAFLVTLGRETSETHLLLLCSLRTGDVINAPQPVSMLRARSGQLKLEPLDVNACNELVQSLFGDVVNSARVANLLFEKSAGNPQHCMELAQLLARKQIAKYVAGTWVLPSQVSSEELPDRLEDVFAAKLAGLRSGARALAEALCIHPKPISIELCVAFAQGLSEAQAHAALADLLSEQILFCIDDMFQFAQQNLRSTLMASLPGPRAQTLHRHAAAVFEGNDALDARMQRGWHLLRAGEELAGAELLASTSRAFIYTASAREDSQNVIAALRTALEIYERHGRSPHERATLLFPLVLLCYYSPDGQLIMGYAPQALRLGLDITGLGVAHKARHVLGKERALRWGMWLAERRFARERKERGLQLTLAQAIGAFSSLVPASVGAFGCHYDSAGTEEVCELAEPLSLFPEDQLQALMYTWKQAQMFMVRGLEGDSRISITRALAQLEQPAMRQALGDAHWRSMCGGGTFMLGLSNCYSGSPAACENADAMDAIGVRMWSMVADQVRLLHHAFRGESERVQHYRDRVDRCALQGGPTWQSEFFWPAAMLTGEVLCGDTIAVRRTYQQLERFSEQVPSLRIYADGARAAYLSLRGDHAQAIALYERVVAEMPERRKIGWLPTRGLFARALNNAGEHARAKHMLLETFSHVTDIDRGVRVLCFEARRQLAVAEAALGNVDVANAMLNGLLSEYQPDGNPLLLGLLHETRAQCALSLRDDAAFAEQLAQVEAYLRSTGNPTVIAYVTQLKQLAAAAVRAEQQAVGAPASDAPTINLPDGVNRSRSNYQLCDLTVAPDRNRYALMLLIQQARAKGGCLYLFDGTSLQLAAASAVNEAPKELEQVLLERILREQSAIESESGLDDDTQIVESLRIPAQPSGRASSWSSPANNQVRFTSSPAPQPQLFRSSLPAARDEDHRLVVLTARRADGVQAIGGVILTLDPGVSVQLDTQLLDAVAHAVQTLDNSRV